VCTIFITAPQQVHSIAARGLIQSDARTGTDFSSTCKSAIGRV